MCTNIAVQQERQLVIRLILMANVFPLEHINNAHCTMSFTNESFPAIFFPMPPGKINDQLVYCFCFFFILMDLPNVPNWRTAPTAELCENVARRPTADVAVSHPRQIQVTHLVAEHCLARAPY